MAWLNNPIIWLDISTFCNAACPQCHRTDLNGLGKQDWLPLLQWDLETFKRAFPDPSRYPQYDFCGTWGDPVMNKDFMRIVEYIFSNSSESKISVDTNGSMRDAEWWWKLGSIGQKRCVVTFAIDGHTQEVHEKYRRKTDLKKVLENMDEFSAAGGISKVLTIIFEHNQEYVGDISKLIYEYGASNHMWYPTDRFEKWNNYKTEFFDGNKEMETLLPADIDKIKIWTDHEFFMMTNAHRGKRGFVNNGFIDFNVKGE